MVARRIIPCLDVRNGQVVKGVQFKQHRVVGDILTLAQHYSEQSADELVFYDISASVTQQRVDPTWISNVADVIDIPFCVAGGIRSVSDARVILNAGADKISVNSPALARPDLINELVDAFGQQCVVIGIDSRTLDEQCVVCQYSGDPTRTIETPRMTQDWVREVIQRGAGEIVLNCMNQDGVQRGYDIEQLKRIRALCTVPLIASGGAGEPRHFVEVFTQANVDGALAASVFHNGTLGINTLKQDLSANAIEVRL